VSWAHGGFYYSRYPEPEKGRELTTKNEFQAVYFHKAGTPQSEDVLVYDDKQNPQRFHNVGTTEDERFAILTISERGKGKKGNSLFYKDLSNPDSNNWKDVLPERTEPLQGVGTAGGKLFASWRKDVVTRAYVFSLDGKLE